MKQIAFMIGIAAGLLCTMSFVPQVLALYRSKRARDISLISFAALGAGVFLWLIYGLLINELPIIIANAVTLVLVGAIIVLKIRYTTSREGGNYDQHP